MKLQGLAVIFCIIIIPISLVMSFYVQTQIDTVVLQTSYDTKLSNATYDAIKAYQLNETNSNTENIASEKIRDIEASVQTFYSALATSLGGSGYTEEDLKPYIPALVYTLYDGYYIYSPYKNIEDEGKITQGLKPYIYYSCRYTASGTDIVVNYTLDNYITIYGTVKGEYVTKSGYLVNPNSSFSPSKENLTEMDDKDTTTEIPYRYINIAEGKRQKIYYKEGEPNSNNGWYYYTVDRKKLPVSNPPTDGIQDDSAQKYYNEANDFSIWVRNELGNLTIGDNESGIEKEGKESVKIFEVSGFNDPDKVGSAFNEHRREVIKQSIQTNLNAAIASYNSISQSVGTTYNFKMPVLKENDWDKILNNVSMISFMQGLPIKNKYYMGYEIVTNTKNKEFVDPNHIYYIQGDTYHKVSCTKFDGTNCIGYRNIDYDRKKSKDGTAYYFPHKQTGDYDCIITATTVSADSVTDILNANTNKAKAHFTALARERYNVYKSNTFK